MKHFLKIISLTLLLAMLVPIGVAAAEVPSSSDSTIYLDDGSYITIETTVINTRAAQTRVGTRTYTYTANNGDIEWKAVLTGTFTYTGTTSTCTASNCTVTINNTSWYEVSRSTGKSGNTATCDLVMGYKVLGITFKKETVNMTLTCSASGVLS